MLTVTSLLIALAVLVAAVALLQARSAARKLAHLSELYWELRYEAGQLKGRVARLEVAAGLRDPEPESDVAKVESKTTFVPLSSLKK